MRWAARDLGLTELVSIIQHERFRAADEIDPDVQHQGDRESGGHDRDNRRDTHGGRGDVAESGDRAGSRLDSES